MVDGHRLACHLPGAATWQRREEDPDTQPLGAQRNGSQSDPGINDRLGREEDILEKEAIPPSLLGFCCQIGQGPNMGIRSIDGDVKTILHDCHFSSLWVSTRCGGREECTPGFLTSAVIFAPLKNRLHISALLLPESSRRNKGTSPSWVVASASIHCFKSAR